jgi:hypothetical protein
VGSEKERIAKENNSWVMPNKLCHNNCNKNGTEMDTLVSGVKNSSKLTVKKKDTLISMELVLLLFCMLKKNMISKR